MVRVRLEALKEALMFHLPHLSVQPLNFSTDLGRGIGLRLQDLGRDHWLEFRSVKRKKIFDFT